MKAKNKNLDLMTTSNLVDLVLQEEQKTINSLKKEKINIAKAINTIIKKLQNGGRVIYIGAGTSGRLGILDAVECKPTFSTDLFLGLMAGGKDAVFKAKEGAEDNSKQSIKDLKKLKINKTDVIVGISASGETPYTVSAVKYAKKIKATTVSITSNPKSTLSKITSHKISPQISEEIISGSSRLRSGTAQKIILNMLSSISMIKGGKVYKNLMIDVQPTNEKLIKRAIRIISIICKVSLNKASLLFNKAKKDTKAAIVMHFKDCDFETAKKLLLKANLRQLIG
ncbi:MAG: N-acetylmuramic acid 6-phosphate etherase [Candidatus Melainabacteria bacterium]|nr:N-acetylmuramic acid 6-phosphate etherase [Candidatus Melainabacteria bacterium]